MNADLEETLKELGPDACAVVARLRAARTVEPSGVARAPVPPRRARLPHVLAWTSAVLAAAALAGVCLLPFVAFDTAPVSDAALSATAAVPVADTPYTLAFAASPASIGELLRTQAADGSWANDYLTRQNAAALRGVSDAAVAYRKAVRYLRAKGLAPLTDREFAERVARARLRPAVS